MFSTKWLLFFSLPLTIQADPWSGTWKLDLKKSQFENFDVPKDMKLVITQRGDQNILVFTFTQGDGKVQSVSITQPTKGGKVLGRDAAEPGTDLAIVEVPDAHHWIYKYSKAGKLVSTRTVTLSPDGKVHEAKMTSMQNGKKVVENEYMVKVDSAPTK